ncbi:MAG: sigma-54 dependent transcriptional regulator [Prevotella sp.]|nr:sigma-54 dependent transcriptional regulator [Prevotella sp.]
MKHGTLLIVDDNRNILTTVKMVTENTFERIICMTSPSGLLTRIREDHPDVVLLDMNFHSGVNNGNEGLYWLREIKRMQPSTAVVLFTAYADIQLAVTGIKDGAIDFIVKPFDNKKLIQTLTNACKKAKGEKAATNSPSGMIWGSSPVMAKLQEMVEKVAPTDANILITGENGTGKEMLAKEIHRLSKRADRQLMPVDMGAITETLFESELFGYVKGAFTDAKADKPGKFELADGGTVFLDEIGNLNYSLQAKLLTVLQRRTIVPVGGSKSIPVDVRVVCATNCNLEEKVRNGEFREDLLYRINTIHLHLPPLRERKGDILAYAHHFLSRYADIYNKKDLQFAPETEERICLLPWYGNIRELQHAVEKAVILCDGCTIQPSEIESSNTTASQNTQQNSIQRLDDMECDMIAKAIRQCDGNLSHVAAQLGISRQTLYNKMKKYNL